MDHIDIVEHNPIVFARKITLALAEGYCVRNKVEGYPYFGPAHNSVRLFKDKQREDVTFPSGFDGKVKQYDPMGFILMLENVALAGYTFKEGGEHYFNELGYKQIELEKLEPIIEKPAKRIPKSKQTVTETEDK